MKTFIYLSKLNKQELYCLSSSCKKEAEEKFKEIEEKLRREIEEKLRREIEEKLRKEMEEKLRREVEEKLIGIVKLQKVIKEKVRRETEQKAREEARRQKEAEEIANKEAEGNRPFKNLSVGSIIKFGRYKQDSDPANGEEEIEWIVLDKKGKQYLVISRYALDCQPYNTELKRVTWETCTLRKWLNETFMESAFNADEKAKIVTTTVRAVKNPNLNIDRGKNTRDRLFLLSIIEANRYFSNDGNRVCVPTGYAKAQRDTCSWWLRTLAHNRHAVYVYNNGSVRKDGIGFCSGYVCVRPALWINLES